MTVKEFCEKYNELNTEYLQKEFIKENLEIKNYLPIFRKDVIATKIAEQTNFKHEKYITDDGVEKDKLTDYVYVNSFYAYLLFCRVVIQEYTNLEIDTEHFDLDYDLLTQTGLLDLLMVGENSLIPYKDLLELKMIIDMKQKDIMTNNYEPHAYISKLINSFSVISENTLMPFLSEIYEQITNANLQDNKIININNKYK